MEDKEALQEIVYMVNDYVNNRNNKQTNFKQKCPSFKQPKQRIYFHASSSFP